MRRPRLHRQLFPTYLTIILLCLLASGWLVTRLIHQFYLEQLTADLKIRMDLVREELEDHFATSSPASLDSLCKLLGRLSETRITVIDSAGAVLGDTDENPARMENHSDRPEFQTALASSMGTALRFSPTLKKKMLYLALPRVAAGRTVGALRVAIPAAAIDATLHRIYAGIALSGILIAVLGGFVSYGAARRISRPLTEMRNGARLFAKGDFARKILSPRTEELRTLADTLNHMAEQLSAKISDLTRQRNDSEAVLSSMVEGVLAMDMDERIIRVNAAAWHLLTLGPEPIQGRFIQEVIPHSDFQRFAARLLEHHRNVEEEIVLPGGGLTLQMQGTLLRDVEGNAIGALIVLNDVTRLRKLENVRREFVANVSHELRTPITSIKGFVETLRDGALQNPTQAAHFLNIIGRHADRLNSIIEDLLSLSRLEQGAQRGDVQLDMGDVRAVIAAAMQSCERQAAEKSVRFHVAIEDEPRTKINPTLLEQAVVNLLDNAIKYTPAGGEIRVGVETAEAEYVVFVQDSGCGIAGEHLPRLFERFYRVDRNRSRERGGTGLGLAIVKHIALAHRGRVSVDSQPGKGSIFRMHLPRTA